MTTTTNTLCERVEAQMAELLEGRGEDVLFEHIEHCDGCRDARHDAAEIARVVADSGADYQHPEDFGARLEAALERRSNEHGDARDPASIDWDDDVPLAGAPAAAPGSTEIAEPDDLDHIAAAAEPTATASVTTSGARAADTAHPESTSKPAEAGNETNTRRRRRGVLAWLRRPRNTFLVGGLGAAAAAAAVALSVAPPQSEQPVDVDGWSGKLVKVSRAGGDAEAGGVEICDSDGCSDARAGARIDTGDTVKTDDRTRAYLELADGSHVALDRSTALVIGETDSADRAAKLESGAIVAEIAKRGDRAYIGLPHGRIDVLGTKLAVRTLGDGAAVDVVRGEVELRDERGRKLVVKTGEEGRLHRGSAPYVTSALALGDAVSWSETGDEAMAVRGLGELKAKKPGESDERKGAVRLASHKVKVRIVDGFARTEIEEVFENETDEVLEGIYRFPLPPDAQIERLALEVDDHFEEGAFVDRDRAAAIWRGAIINAAVRKPQIREEIIWVPGPWKDPALLEWQRGGRFELRIFPIPRKGSRRIVLSYTQVVQPSGDARRYVYPLPHDPSGDLRVDDFSIDVQVRGHDRDRGVVASGYTLAQNEIGGGQELTMQAASFVPTGDLVVEYATEESAELNAWAYQPRQSDGDVDGTSSKETAAADAVARAEVNDYRPYAAIALRPELPRSQDDAHRAYVIVVDSSRSMFGERYRRATAVTSRLIAELDRFDKFTVMACDSTCRSLGDLQEPSSSAAAAAAAFLDGIDPDGASDPAKAIEQAARAGDVASDHSVRVVYIGDGTPTVGPIRPGDLERAAERALPAGRGTVTAVAIGADSDTDALAALTRGGGGVVLPYVPGQRVSEAVYAIVGATYGQGLRDVSVELPAGFELVAPSRPDTIMAGGEAIVTARMSAPAATGEVVLRGKVGDQPFEKRYPLNVAATSDSGNAFVPRLYAAARIADLERQGGDDARQRAVALSGAFNVASRYTSLLVLESATMFKAFGLDNVRRTAEWTGETEAFATRSGNDRNKNEQGRLDNADEWSKDKADGASVIGGLGFGSGPGGGSLADLRNPFGDEGGNMPTPDDDAFGADEVDSDFSGFTKRPSSTPAMPSRPKPQPAPAPRPSAAPPAKVAATPMQEKKGRAAVDGEAPWREEQSWRARRFVPMRRIFERNASISSDRTIPLAASSDAIRKLEDELTADPNRRETVRQLHALYQLSGQVEQAANLAERWVEKEPLDPEALTARADVMARRGNRDEAIRLLGSVVDVRPGDVPSQKRLARLHRWAGRPELGCRHSIALAQLRERDGELLAEAVRCGRRTGESNLVDSMLRDASDDTRRAAQRDLDKPEPSESLRGEVRLEATWDTPGVDLDIALIHPDGLRVSWLGAPTRAIISAEDVTSTRREGLALLGSKAGEYAIEIVRGSQEIQGPVSGEITVRAAGQVRKIPFTLTGERQTVGTMRIFFTSRLVPL